MSTPCIDEFGNDICHLVDYSRNAKPKPTTALSKTRIRNGGFRSPPTKPPPAKPPNVNLNGDMLFSKYGNDKMAKQLLPKLEKSKNLSAKIQLKDN